MACARCSCGPVVVRPNVTIDQVDVDLPDREFLPLCDVQGDGSTVTFLRRYTVDPDGTVTVLNTTLDGVTAYAPTGTVGLCQPDAEEQAPEVDRIGQVLCDIQADGTSVAFLRSWTVDNTTGAVSAPVDTALDGTTPYAVTGTPSACGSGGDAQCCPDTEILPLCDTQPDGSSVPFLRHYTVPAEGPVTAADTALDGTTAYAPTGTVGVCLPEQVLLDAEPVCYTLTATGTRIHSGTKRHDDRLPPPGFLVFDAAGTPVDTAAGGYSEVPCASNDVELQVLCDLGADPVTRFLRAHVYDASGAHVETRDTLLDGVTPYALVGAAGACPDAADCRTTSTVLLCETDPDASPGEFEGTATLTDIDPTPYKSFGPVLPLPGGGQALWDGNPLLFPEETTPAPGYTQQWHWAVAATVEAGPVPGCDDGTGTATVTCSVEMENLGPNPVYRLDGLLRLVQPGGTVIAQHRVPTDAPVGWTGTLTVSATIPATQLAAGDLIVYLDTENFDSPTGGKAWEGRNFTTDVVFNVLACPEGEPFMRHVVTDCDGNVVSTTDTDLNGQPITVTGDVGQCETVGGGPVPPPCGDIETVELCDVADDGTTTAFVRHFRYSCNGAVDSVTDTTLNGDPYNPAGTVRVCGEDCADTETLLLCDRVDGDSTQFLRRIVFGCDGAPTTVTDTTLDGTTPYAVQGTVEDCRPPCPELKVVQLCDDTGGFLRFIGLTCSQITSVVDFELDAATSHTVVGDVHVCSDQPELFQHQEVLCDTQPSGIVVSFVRKYIEEAAGTVTATVDATLDGDPYTPTGVVGVCQPDLADREGICYTLTSTVGEVHAGWARHQDSLPNTPQTPNGIAFFDATGNPVDPTADGFAVVPCAGCARQVVERCGCDDTTGDGNSDVSYVEVWAVDPCSGDAPTLLGTYRDGDFTQPYTPVAPVDCPADGADVPAEFDVIQQVLCDVQGDGSAVAFLRQWTVNNTAGTVGAAVDRTLDGVTAYTPTGTVGVCQPQEEGAAEPLLTGIRRLAAGEAVAVGGVIPVTAQSVTVTVISGTATVGTNDGTATIPAGVSLTWSINDHDDPDIGALSAAADTPGDVIVHWTTK